MTVNGIDIVMVICLERHPHKLCYCTFLFLISMWLGHLVTSTTSLGWSKFSWHNFWNQHCCYNLH